MEHNVICISDYGREGGGIKKSKILLFYLENTYGLKAFFEVKIVASVRKMLGICMFLIKNSSFKNFRILFFKKLHFRMFKANIFNRKQTNYENVFS